MAYTGAKTAGNELTGSSGKSSAFGKTETIGKKRLFSKSGAGKLNTSGATTKSESLSRLRGKGALA